MDVPDDNMLRKDTEESNLDDYHNIAYPISSWESELNNLNLKMSTPNRN
jgi:hypothetical protein